MKTQISFQKRLKKVRERNNKQTHKEMSLANLLILPMMDVSGVKTAAFTEMAVLQRLGEENLELLSGKPRASEWKRWTTSPSYIK